METKKSLFRRLFELALLAGMAVGLVWVLSLGVNAPKQTAEPAAVLAVESPYPPPATATPFSTLAPTTVPPYPPPTLGPLASIDYCANMGQWLTYTNQAAGFSIQYPSEAKVHNPALADVTQDHSRIVSFTLYPHCYTDSQGCNSDQVSIQVLQNPQELQINEFIEQEFQLTTSPPSKDASKNYQETGYFVDIGGVHSFRVEAGIRPAAQPEIFVPHGNRVLLIAIGRGMMPPFGPPCKQILQLLDQMLNTLILFPPQQ